MFNEKHFLDKIASIEQFLAEMRKQILDQRKPPIESDPVKSVKADRLAILRDTLGKFIEPGKYGASDTIEVDFMDLRDSAAKHTNRIYSPRELGGVLRELGIHFHVVRVVNKETGKPTTSRKYLIKVKSDENQEAPSATR